jgi:NADH-quinone oxidoreductase subunit M
MNSYVALLSLIVFLPTVVGLLIALLVPRDKPDLMKLISLLCTFVVFAITVWMAIPDWNQDTAQFDFTRSSEGLAIGAAEMQNVFNLPWIPSFDIYYFMGMDGISFPLVLLTTFIFFLSMWASWGIEKQVKGYCALFLLLETGVLGVFLALDFFLFYVFWEVMLLPMYFLIGIWGGPRKEYAAIKFFLYTLLGGAVMLIAVLVLYFNSDLKLLSAKQLEAAHVTKGQFQKSQYWTKLTDDEFERLDLPALLQQADQPVHTFNIMAMQQIGQLDRSPFNEELLWGKSIAWWSFLLLFIGFAIKVPAVPVHTWLPDAHVEAPTPISMILAGVLLKLGGYGIIRICYPICPAAGYDLAYFVCIVGVLSMLYGALAAMAQKDFKRLVAYSSVSHMGYVVLGMGVWSLVSSPGGQYNPQYWQLGMNGAMFQMLAHGFSSPGMFFLVGVIYDRVHHRNLDEFGGLFRKMPIYAGLSIVIFFAGLGLPGLCGFWGEVFVTLSAWNFSKVLAILSALTVILTAGYILWTVQRVYLGPEYKGPHGDHLHEMTFREKCIAAPLVAAAVLFGVYPQAALNYVSPSVNASVQELVDWAQVHHPPGSTQTVSTDAPPKEYPAFHEAPDPVSP